MKGLLIKDLHMGKIFFLFYFIAVAAMLVGAVMGEGELFFFIYPMLFSAIIPVSLIGYDERDKWEAYSGTLPYTRGQLVNAKYLLGLCFGVVVFFMSATAMLVRMQRQDEFSLEKLAWMGTAMLVMGCLSSALMLPLMFKYGVEKGRVAFVAAAGLCFAISVGLARVGFQVPLLDGGLWPLAVVAGVVILLYVLSWRLSIFFYQKREL